METSDRTFRIVPTAEGPAAVVGGPQGLVRVLLPGLPERDLRREVRTLEPEAREDPKGFRRAGKVISRFFETGRLAAGGIPLDLEGVGPFRAAVYEALRGIPTGETVTYAELARRIGRPGAHRSVGTALSRNPLPLFVPCHRVVRTDGGLGGFTAPGGLELKRRMLALESRRRRADPPIC